MHCGCPLPDPTIGQKLAGFIIQSPPARRVDLVPPLILFIYPATHPSDHNAISSSVTHDISKFESARAKRSDEFLRRRERDRLLMEKGKFDRSVWARGSKHEAAFFVPISNTDDLTRW